MRLKIRFREERLKYRVENRAGERKKRVEESSIKKQGEHIEEMKEHRRPEKFVNKERKVNRVDRFGCENCVNSVKIMKTIVRPCRRL